MKRLFFLLLIISTPSLSFAQSSRPINSDDARQIAERFVACSGYAPKRLQSKECGEFTITCNDQTMPCDYLEKRAFVYFPQLQNVYK